jgi:cell division protein FtsQ
VAVAASATLAAAAFASTYTPWFAADEVVVRGARRLGAEGVRSLAGLAAGVNVFHLDVGAVERALEADPRIAEAVVERDLPDRVIVTVRERVPVAAAFLEGGPIAVAADGTALPGAPVHGLPTIRPVAGDLVPAAVVDAAAALDALPPTVRQRVEVAVVGLTGDLELELDAGPTVAYGPPVDPVAKAEALVAVLRWAGERGLDLTSVDVSVPAAPSARTAEGDAPAPA